MGAYPTSCLWLKSLWIGATGEESLRLRRVKSYEAIGPVYLSVGIPGLASHLHMDAHFYSPFLPVNLPSMKYIRNFLTVVAQLIISAKIQ